ncbi:MAG: low specificity L-threonine aldolase [Microscillaceae bacterium]|jgi:threonine aldolase|nr:low specificity L-threonine aldolase [Microscillaceae bacterium]
MNSAQFKSFASDNYAGVLPEVMQALQAANAQHARSYGNDEISQRTQALFAEVFGAEVSVSFVFNGTGANVLSISLMTQSFNSVLCADTSHIYVDESTAPETFTGCRFVPLPTNHLGKVEPETIRRSIIRVGDEHHPQIRAFSLAQSTEYGTVYTLAELQAISAVLKEKNLYFHIDGARLFNAAASLGCSLAELSTQIGLDILSVGGTKAGMMFGEAVVIFNPELARYQRFRHKQSMQLASKTRFIAAQFEALLSHETWRKSASHSNQMANYFYQKIQKYPQIQVTKPVDANAVFAILPADWIAPLQAVCPFYVWNEQTNEVRWMCSFDTQVADIDRFVAKIEGLA